MSLLVHLSPQLYNSIKFDYYMIYMKHYVWILTKRKAQNLYMICVSPVNYSLLVTHVKQTDLHYMLAAPIWCKILPLAIQNKALASLANASVSKKAQFNQLLNWIGQLHSTAESVISMEVILWLAITLSSSLRTVRIHLLFK